MITRMKQVTTVACKLQVTKNISSEIDELLVVFAAACEWINANTPKDLTNKTKMQKLVYNQVREQFGLSSNLAIQALRRVCSNRKTARQKNRNIRKFSPTSATYDARIFSFRESDWSISIKLLKSRAKIPLHIGNYQRGILKGQDPKSATLVKRRNGDYYIHINLEHDVPEPYEAKEVLGLDLGRVDICHTSEGDKWDGKNLKAKRNHYAWLRLILQKKASLGTRSSRRRCRQLLQRLSGKEKRFRAALNHVISRRLVDQAATNGQAIAIEDLTGIRERTNQEPRSKTERRHSNNWSFYMLRQFLTYKCVLKSVPLILVNPAYTSVSCHKCLHIGNRNGKSFRCVNPECLNKCDSDRNGAENIAALGRSINTPRGSGLACKLSSGVREYIQLNLFNDNLGLLKTTSTSTRPQVC
ncbi:MAG: transposase [Xenococcaceae cyanobacterium MO_167.B52]|nr:transposase [Xenococcaceae cyanobacterium MO_167.B52]